QGRGAQRVCCRRDLRGKLSIEATAMRFLIGIDLGTTNSALAYIDLQRRSSRPPEVQTFAMGQLVAPGEMAKRALLPSFLYLPGAHDLPPRAVALPWDANRSFAVGEFARNHG